MNYYELFGLKNPYLRFKSDSTVISNVYGWTGDHHFLSEIVLRQKPKLIIEVGSFLGQSAINMGKALKSLKIDAHIICIDTWLGSPEHWRTDKCNNLKLFNYFGTGISSLYDQFVKNVMLEELDDVIVPMPNTSAHIFEILKWKEIKADLIYIDGSHEESDVYKDIEMYSQLLSPNGILFGDDYSSWPAVKRAADKYVSVHNLKVRVNYNNFWELIPNDI